MKTVGTVVLLFVTFSAWGAFMYLQGSENYSALYDRCMEEYGPATGDEIESLRKWLEEQAAAE